MLKNIRLRADPSNLSVAQKPLKKPPALLRLIELVNAKKARPALIVGLPVGFVNAAESKSDLIETGYPYISNVGRKGGSNVAASVVNALAILAGQKHSAQCKGQRA